MMEKRPLKLVQSTLYCAPWHILPAAHEELCGLYQRYLKGDLAGRAARVRTEVAVETPRMQQEGERLTSGIAWAADAELGMAVVWLEGVIAKRCPDTMSGPAVVDLVVLDELLAEIGEMEVETVVFDFDSPGGCAVGLPETGQRILELGERKRTVAYTNYSCCSAAYWLAVCCGEVYAAPSAYFGSVGTYVAALDSSRRFEMEGMELKLFRVGKLKALGHAGKEWTPEEEAFLEEMVARHGAEFREHVRSRRPGVADESMEGQWFFGSEAPGGMIDGTFRDLSELLGALLEGRRDGRD